MVNTPNNQITPEIAIELEKFRPNTKRRCLIETLLKYPDGIGITDLTKESGLDFVQIRDNRHKIKERSNLIIIQKLNTFRITLKKNLIPKSIPSGIPPEIIKECNTFRKNTKTWRILEAFIDNNGSIDREELFDTTGLQSAQIRDLIYKIKKNSNLNFRTIGNKFYIILDNNENTGRAHLKLPIENKPTLAIPDNPLSEIKSTISKDSNISNQIIPRSYLKKLANLPEYDKKDVFDMLKKAYYYQKSAMSLIDANEIINNISDNIFN